MNGKLVLLDNVFSDEFEFEIGPSIDGFSLEIYVDEEKSLEKQLKNRKSFDYCMKIREEFRNLDDEVDEFFNEEEEQVKYISEHFDNILESVEYIVLSFDELNYLDFIKKNPIVLTKKIILSEKLDITDFGKLMKMLDEYKDIVDRVYVYLVGNTNCVSLLDCYKTMNIIKRQADMIKKLYLSPMETIMYVYDLVRNRVYTFEDENESYFKSRDLTEVLFGNKIVCLGYANIFYVLLHYIGIDSRVVYLYDKKNSNSGHARNVIYVKDDKYDIDGVYYFDVTWDSRRENENSEYLYRYRYFAKTKKFMDEDRNYDFMDGAFPIYSVDMDKRIERIVRDGDYEKLIPYSRSLNYMSRLVNGSSLINSYCSFPIVPVFDNFNGEEFLGKFKEVFSKFNKELSADVMLRLFNNVRKIEYYQNSEWYPYSLDDMYKTCMMSDWQFTNDNIDIFIIMLQILFDGDINSMSSFNSYGSEAGIFKDIEGVRFTKVLQKVLEKKKN